MNNKDIQNVYYNLTALKAPPPILESLYRVITELYECTLIADEIETEGLDENEDYASISDYYENRESVDDMIREEQYQELMADYYLSREKDEGTEYYC